MQISVESTSNLGRKINISVPSDEIENKVSEKLKDLAKKVKIDGFRPGKVPVKVVKDRYGESVRSEVIGDVMQSSLYDALIKENLNPAATPTIEELKAEAGQPLEYVATFEVYPEIKIKEFSELNVEKTNSTIADKDIDKMLESIRKQHTEWKEVDRKAKKDDRLNIDFDGSIDGTPFEGGKAENVNVILGSKSFIPGFEDGLIGRAKDQELVLDVKFPEDYPSKELAGKDAKFAVKVHKVEEPSLPELNDEFFAKMGVKEGGLEAFKKQVSEHMQRELDRVLQLKLKQEVFDKLADAHEVEIPSSLITQELQHFASQFQPKDAKQAPDIDKLPDNVKEEAKKRVKLSLIFSEIIKANELKADAAKVRELVEEMAKSYQDPQHVIAWYYSDKKRLAELEASALESQIVDLILESAKLTEKDEPYNKLMNINEE